MNRILALLLFTSICLCSFGQSVGLVLSGGGARGLAHIGAIRALEESHIPIDFIVGTSAGAVVGCLYALGYSPQEMDSIVRTSEFESWATGKWNAETNYYFSKPADNASWITLRFSLDSMLTASLPTNLVSSVPYDFALLRGTSSIIARAHYDFDSLFVPFRCVASDIADKERHVFRNGDLARAVRASSAYPFYFRPVSVEGTIYYDGGLYDNFPADVMREEFHPDRIIGINASGDDRPTSETDLLYLLQAMMTVPTNLSIRPEEGILIDLETEKFGLFDFSKTASILEEGYSKTKSKLDSIRLFVSERTDSLLLRQHRSRFRSGMSPMRIATVAIEGLNPKQATYVRAILKPDSSSLSLDEFRHSYFRLTADPNIRQLDPQLLWRPQDSLFDLRLKIARERNLTLQFGGNISSRPISEAYAGINYRFWSRRSYSLNTNFYFGRLYTSGQFTFRMDAPTRLPYFMELDATLNQYDYFRSTNAFFQEQRPSYLLKSDYHFGGCIGVPYGNKGEFTFRSGYVRIADNYYPTMDFAQTDTADKTTLRGFTGRWMYEWSTQEKKQYANQGARFLSSVRYTNIMEQTIPGSKSTNRSVTEDYHDWIQARVSYENYVYESKHLRLGFSTEAVVSDMPFLNNYTVSVVNAPSYEPILEMRTLFLPQYHAHTFLSAGSKNVVALRQSLDLRLEAYIFQPYKELLQDANNRAYYGKPLDKRYYLASGGVVFHSPVGPISFQVNYYTQQKNPVSVLFTAGFLLFNPGALD